MRTGTSVSAPWRERSIVDRFWGRVKRGTARECWLWQGPPRGGYGRFYIGKRSFQAHRIALTLASGRGPDDALEVMHSCDVPLCCNPAHLSPGTTRDNIRDCMRKGRGNRQRGERHGRAKLTDSEVSELLELAERGVRQTTLSGDFGISLSHVNALISGEGRVDARVLKTQRERIAEASTSRRRKVSS